MDPAGWMGLPGCSPCGCCRGRELRAGGGTGACSGGIGGGLRGALPALSVCGTLQNRRQQHTRCGVSPGLDLDTSAGPMPGVAWAAEVEQRLKAGPVVISLVASLRVPRAALLVHGFQTAVTFWASEPCAPSAAAWGPQSEQAGLLTAMVRDPALQLSVNGPANHRGNPNENLARELLELFSLGEGGPSVSWPLPQPQPAGRPRRPDPQPRAAGALPAGARAGRGLRISWRLLAGWHATSTLLPPSPPERD